MPEIPCKIIDKKGRTVIKYISENDKTITFQGKVYHVAARYYNYQRIESIVRVDEIKRTSWTEKLKLFFKGE